jgi:hypothetical protein
MTMFNFLKKLSPFDQVKSASVRPVEAPKEAPQPELSCFVKGLIRSMKETPDEWRRSEMTMFTCRWTHSSGISIAYDSPLSIDPRGRGTLLVDGEIIHGHEHDVIVRALYDHLEGPVQAEHARVATIEKTKEDAERAARRAPFEKLGCP